MQVPFIFILSLYILNFNSVLSQNICNFSVSIHQKLLRPGFHRFQLKMILLNLTYYITIENHSLHNKNKPVYFYDGCMLGVQQLLPAGVYVDSDELEDLRRRNKLSAFPHHRVNIEVAAPYAHPFNAYIFSLVKFNKVQTFLPVHGRYQRPVDGGGMVANTISNPSVYLRCPDRRLEDCDMPIKTRTYLCDKDPEDKCIWKQVPSIVSNNTVIWEVPVGNLNHYYLVEVGTMLTTLLGFLSIVHVTHTNPMSFRRRRDI